MIAAATQATGSTSLDNLPFGWFDIALVAVIAFGLFRGRKNGMTKELLPMLHWVATLFVCALCYEMVAQAIINISGWGKAAAYVTSYLVLMFAVFFIFVFVKNFFTPRLEGSNFFGRGEYYLGMVSGLLRFSCILLVALALLNAPFYTDADIKKSRDYNARWFGGGMEGYAGDYFPTVQSVQESVFKKSLTGPFIKKYAGVLLINSVAVEADQPKPVPKNKPVIYFGN